MDVHGLRPGVWSDSKSFNKKKKSTQKFHGPFLLNANTNIELRTILEGYFYNWIEHLFDSNIDVTTKKTILHHIVT